MNQKSSSHNVAFDMFAWIALLGGIVVYVIGLIRSQMELNEMGFYFAVLLLGLFATIAVQEGLRNRFEGIPVSGIFSSLAMFCLLTALTMFVIALFRVDLLPSEIGFYGISYFLALFGSVAVHKMVRDRENLGARIMQVEPSKASSGPITKSTPTRSLDEVDG